MSQRHIHDPDSSLIQGQDPHAYSAVLSTHHSDGDASLCLDMTTTEPRPPRPSFLAFSGVVVCDPGREAEARVQLRAALNSISSLSLLSTIPSQAVERRSRWWTSAGVGQLCTSCLSRNTPPLHPNAFQFTETILFTGSHARTGKFGTLAFASSLFSTFV